MEMVPLADNNTLLHGRIGPFESKISVIVLLVTMYSGNSLWVS